MRETEPNDTSIFNPPLTREPDRAPVRSHGQKPTENHRFSPALALPAAFADINIADFEIPWPEIRRCIMGKRIDETNIASVIGTLYPPPFDQPCRSREHKKLGDAAGLTQFGVNLLRLPPGSLVQSAALAYKFG